MSDRPYQMLPPLDTDQLDLLRQSIVANGVLEPVVFDEDGEILDGHHRVEIAEELDIEYPRRVVTDLDEAGKRRYAITTNVARRQLVPAVRGALVAQLRTQGMSIRQIAEATRLPKTTVARDLDQVSQVGHLPETVTGSDGKTYAATRPTPQTPGPVDKAPPVDPGMSNRPTDSGLSLAVRAGEERPVLAAAESTDGPVATPPSPEVATGNQQAEGFAALDGELDAEMEGTASRFRRNFSAAITRADDVWGFDPDRIAEVYAGDFAQAIRPFLDEMTQWCERVSAAHRRGSGLRVVSGGAR